VRLRNAHHFLPKNGRGLNDVIMARVE